MIDYPEEVHTSSSSKFKEETGLCWLGLGRFHLVDMEINAYTLYVFLPLSVIHVQLTFGYGK